MDNYSKHSNKDNYKTFILTFQYRQGTRFALTLWDLEFIIKDILDSHRVSYVDNKTYVALQEMFLDTYLEARGINRWVVKESCQTLGLKALDMLKTDEQWVEYSYPAKHLDLLVRCLCFDFKRSSKVKRLLKGWA